jgi:glutamate mutase epsilon subunit
VLMHEAVKYLKLLSEETKALRQQVQEKWTNTKNLKLQCVVSFKTS